MTYAELLKCAAQELNDAGIEGARREAELLLAYALGIRREELYLRSPMSEVDADATAIFQEVIIRRAGREPLAYITGVKEFYGLPFAVDQRVLIPRPETELLVELCLEELERRSFASCPYEPSGCPAEQPPFFVVADICTGSGAIGIAIAVSRPDVIVLASDISGAALEVAVSNAQRHGVSERIVFSQGDLFSPWQWQPNAAGRHNVGRYAGRHMDRYAGRRMDVILCNPPYIPQDEIATLQPEIRLFEPTQALDGGVDGLAFYRRLFWQASTFLNQNGVLLIEIGYGQQDAVLRLGEEAGWNAIAISDLAGITRAVVAKRA